MLALLRPLSLFGPSASGLSFASSIASWPVAMCRSSGGEAWRLLCQKSKGVRRSALLSGAFSLRTASRSFSGARAL
eukprot:10352561-Alexandrium_andersonii.AAC.1